MRQLSYLSPTSIMTYQKDKEAFYLQYCADNRPPREPQNQAMAIGAAFDAYVKAYLTTSLFGERGFKFEEIFENQVEPHNRDWALKHGAWAFDCYKKSGALADLLMELQGAENEPRFEMQIENRVEHLREGDVPLLGKPDIWYIRRGIGWKVVHDWKVNGYCSPKTTSPKKGYIELYDGGERRGFHKNIMPRLEDGLYVNRSYNLETVDVSWATQTTIYSWILGADVGEEAIVGIHQLCCKNGGENRFPIIRTAAHRSVVSSSFQKELWGTIKEIWGRITSGNILDDPERQKVLNQFYSGDDKDDFLEVIR